MHNKTTQFILILFLTSILSAGLFFLLGGEYGSPIGMAFVSAYMFFPMASVIIVQLMHKEPVLKHLGTSFKVNRWFFVGWLLAPVFNILALLASGLFGMTPSINTPMMTEAVAQMSEQMPGITAWGVLGITLVSGLIAGISINALFAYGEEIAWRGWLLKRFEGVPFLTTNIIIGAIWGLWHSPIILMGHNYPQHPVIGVFMMVAFCIAFTPAITYIRIKSKSVVAAAIMHGTLNAGAGLSVFCIEDFNDILGGSPGVAGILTLLVITALLFLFDRYITKENIFTSGISCSRDDVHIISTL